LSAGCLGTTRSSPLPRSRQANGVACEMLSPTVEELVAIGLPALARIKTGSGDAWIGLMRTEGGLLHITTDAEPAVVTTDVFRTVFANQAAVYLARLRPQRTGAERRE